MKKPENHFFRPFRRCNLLFPLLILVFLDKAASLNMVVEPLIPNIVTNVDLAHYDISGTGAGAPIFRINIYKPENEEMTLVIYYSILFKQIGMADFANLYEGKTDDFILSKSEKSVSVTSNQFLQKNNTGAKFSRYKTVVWDDNDPVRNQLMSNVLKAGNFVSGKIVYRLNLMNAYTKEVYATDELQAEIMNVSQISPLSPGIMVESIHCPLSEAAVEIMTSQPQFRWTSDLPPGIYDGQEFWPSGNVFRISIYQLPENATSVADVLVAASRNPFATIETKELSAVYPSSARELTTGLYAWKVEGHLLGPVNTSLSSSLMVFSKKESSSANAGSNDKSIQIRQIIEQLKFSLTGTGYENMVDQLSGYDADINTFIEGKPITLEELKALIAKIQTHEIEIENVRIR
ncbi:hypothetical protein ACFL5V_06560 [Fibrobacterota bacterium]